MICNFMIFSESVGSGASLSAETSRKSEVKKTSDFFMPTTRPGTARLSSISRVPGERRLPIIGHFRQNHRMTLLLFGAIPHLRAPSGKGIYFKYKSRKFSSIFFAESPKNFFLRLLTSPAARHPKDNVLGMRHICRPIGKIALRRSNKSFLLYFVFLKLLFKFTAATAQK